MNYKKNIIIFFSVLAFVILWGMMNNINLKFGESYFNSIAQPIVIFIILISLVRKQCLSRRDVLKVPVILIMITFGVGPLEAYLTMSEAEREVFPVRKYFMHPGVLGTIFSVISAFAVYWSVFSVKRIVGVLIVGLLYFNFFHAKIFDHWLYILRYKRLGPEVENDISLWPVFTDCDEESTPVDLRKMKDKILVLDVWFQHCGECYQQFPEFESLKKAWAHDTTVVFYNLFIDFGRDTSFDPCALKESYDFNIIRTGSAFYDILDVDGLPVYYIIKDGQMRYEGNKERLNEFIEKLSD